MQTVHRITIVGKCPLGCQDIYQAEFHISNKVIEVGDIADAIKEATENPIYQEVLTQLLADNTGCRVVTVGRHSQFETTCEAEPFEE
jgi:hypothetical protein